MTFSMGWDQPVSTTATFPLPVPHPGVWQRSGPGLSRRKLHQLAQRRLLHVVVMALNYHFCGGLPSLTDIRRPPNAWHLSVFERLRSSLFACGSTLGQIPLSPGRSGPQLVAALGQLEAFCDNHLKSGRYEDVRSSRFEDDKELFPKDKYPQLSPYKQLDVSRLRIVGGGKWPMERFLQGSIYWLPFLEPSFLWHNDDTSSALLPNFEAESFDENLKLARLWDSRGLLRIFDRPAREGHFSRVFNAFKDCERDRQIGDRRLPNCEERHIDGPSAFLPQGQLLCNIRLPRFKVGLRGSITDRRDFYHQAEVSHGRAQSNLLPFEFPRSCFPGFDFEKNFHQAKKKSREVGGDGFGDRFYGGQCPPQSSGCYVGFGSLFQGDHLGVEFALASHERLMIDGGLLVDERRIMGHSLFPTTVDFEGLIIDDYFYLSSQPLRRPAKESNAYLALAEARMIYGLAGLEGSPEKDVEAQDTFKAAGAEVISKEAVVRRGLVSVGAPGERRLALGLLSLRAAALPCISSRLASRLSGNWVSVMLYRRCFSSVVSDFFMLAAEAEKCRDGSRLVPLPRGTAQELVLLSIFSPLIVSNLAADVSPWLFATDASMEKGAIVKKKCCQDLCYDLWLGAEKKGSYTKLSSGFAATLACLGEEGLSNDCDEEAVEAERFNGPYKSPLMYYDFIELYGGAGVVSKHALALGLVVAPPIDLSASQYYNLADIRLLEWVLEMIRCGRIRALMLEPPCTSFSPARHPMLRSYAEPLGFDRLEPQTWAGNRMAFFSFVIMRWCRAFFCFCLLEQPRRSKMCWTKFWKALLASGFDESIIASCCFGSPHQKEFRMLHWGLSSGRLTARCPGGHHHVKIEGRFTKPSAIYVDGLGKHLAEEFYRVLAWKARQDADLPKVDGFESVVVNDLLCSPGWSEMRSWSWKGKSHINIFEGLTVVSLLKEAALVMPDSRLAICVDSRVCIGSLAKGRSSSRALQRVCRLACCWQVAGGLFPGLVFAPTRLNVADDPSRSAPLRESAEFSLLPALHRDDVRRLNALRFSRPAAGWIRLTLLILTIQLHPSSAEPSFAWTSTVSQSLWTWFRHFGSAIDSLGFSLSLLPLAFVLFSAFGLVSSFLRSWRPLRFGCGSRYVPCKFALSLLIVLSLVGQPIAMEPTSGLEQQRAEQRSGVELVATRVARRKTLKNREGLLAHFRAWLLKEHDVSFSIVLSLGPPDVDEVNHWLVEFGEAFCLAGKACEKYAGTINAVAGLRPILRKQLTEAWDLAFGWIADEPFRHHPALPLAVMLILVSIALLWVWPNEASVVALTWSGILRIGKRSMVQRKDLILPIDLAPGCSYAPLRIKRPKTQGRSAKHQSARADPIDIVALLSATYGRMRDDEHLWPYSAATLRRGFASLLTALDLPPHRSHDHRPFELGSLRCFSVRVIEIYLQEVQFSTYPKRLTATSRSKIEKFSASFPDILKLAMGFLQTAIPTKAWYALFQAKDVQ